MKKRSGIIECAGKRSVWHSSNVGKKLCVKNNPWWPMFSSLKKGLLLSQTKLNKWWSTISTPVGALIQEQTGTSAEKCLWQAVVQSQKHLSLVKQVKAIPLRQKLKAQYLLLPGQARASVVADYLCQEDPRKHFLSVGSC